MKSLFRAASMAALLLISGCELMSKRAPYPDPGRLVSVVKVSPAGEEMILDTDFLALRNQSKTLASIAAHVFRARALTGGSEPERIQSELASADFFPTLGVRPVLGREFISEDCKPGGDHVAVISYRLWQGRYSGDPSLIGRTIALDGEQYTVVGVMPDNFQFPKFCDVWTPLAFDAESLPVEKKGIELHVIARLKNGVTLEQAQVEMSEIAHKLETDYPATNTGRDIKLAALRESYIQGKRVMAIKINRPVNPTPENSPPVNSPIDKGKEK
jgi:putative ABC transport system permease protein